MTSSTLMRWAISSAARPPPVQACCRKLHFILRLRPVMMLSSTVMPLNSAMFWKVRAMPCSAACGAPSSRSAPGRRSALPGVIDAVDHVEHRALAGAVGADDERISCSRTLKLMSVSAFTPPKRSEMFCGIDDHVRQSFWPWVVLLRRPSRLGRALGVDAQVGATLLLRPSS